MFRRCLALIIISALLLAGCGTGSGGWSALALASSTAGDAAGDMYALLPGDEAYESYVEDFYGLGAFEMRGGAILSAGGSSADEVAVFEFCSQSDAGSAAENLREYLVGRESDFAGYMPSEAEKAASGVVVTHGAWCALIILSGAASAAETFERCFEMEAPTQVGVSFKPRPSAAPDGVENGWTYSESRILEAWESGERAGLDAHDAAILDAAEAVLAEHAPEGLGLYERELAIHDFLISNAQYDDDELSRLPYEGGSPYNTNPYGALVEGLAVCSGYSSAFQLLMRMAGYECITVRGSANADREEHAWNMVRLDGEWYCVDVTWDDPIGALFLTDSTAHRYFNVTSEFMRDTAHYWDEGLYPEADADEYAWRG